MSIENVSSVMGTEVSARLLSREANVGFSKYQDSLSFKNTIKEKLDSHSFVYFSAFLSSCIPVVEKDVFSSILLHRFLILLSDIARTPLYVHSRKLYFFFFIETI